MYKLKKIVGSYNFSEQFIKITSHDKKIGYNPNVLQQTACLVVNPITVGNFVFLFNCRPVGRLQTLPVYLLDFFCTDIQFYLLLSSYICFISFSFLDLYVLGDDGMVICVISVLF